MSPIVFKKLARQLRELEDDYCLFEIVATKVAEQVEEPKYDINLAYIAAVPREAQAVYWLWRFICEVSLNGIEDFILQSAGMYAQQTHAALAMVGARELMRRLEAAIPLAGPSAQFTELSDQSWFNQFQPVPEFAALESVDRPQSGETVYKVVRGLPGLVAAFIRRNADVLIEA